MSKKRVFLLFLEHILAILYAKWVQMATFGGSQGVQNQFLGPQTNSGPHEKRFWSKKFVRKKVLSEPGRGPVRPKGGPDRSVGASNPSKTIRRTQKPWKSGVFWPCNSLCSQNYAQNTFLGHFGRFGGRLGPTSGSPCRGLPETQNSKIIHVMRGLGQKNFQASQQP